ncbi:hypothetical protein [Brucella rhizosphaerae]|uniref:Uncharacterized protein n=1 Tax=Brucella rhizosphaerae TaxID=571254 RepID=A0A256FPD8_9HYPH|nr:hypothetical protein [Brucella rhizosphaerae]OYR16709.1 hypothetical protein CEV32_4343 [Brucella rhizosphaerae]
MVTWQAGWKPGVGPVMKVMKYDSDDPFAIPNSAFSRFYFNSEADNLSYVYSHFQTERRLNKADYPNGNYGLVSGSLADSWVMQSSTGSFDANEYRIYGCIGRMSDLAGMLPFAECKFVSSDGTVRVLYNNKPSSSGAYFQSVTNTAVTANVYPDSHQGKFGYQDIPATFGYSGWAIRPTTQANAAVAHITGDQDFMTSMIWDLPCNNVPIPRPSGTPVTGQVAFMVDQPRVKLARPGFEINSASGRQLILDSDRTPIKCVMMGTTPQIQPGNSYYAAKPVLIDFDLSPSMVCDTIVSLNGWDFAIPPVNLNSGFTEERTWVHYRVDAGGIWFTVTGTLAATIRFMLHATGRAGRTSGGSDITRGVNGKYFQIKRPGSSDVAPGYNDILVDTRFSAVTVLADNYVPRSSFTSGESVHWRYGSVGRRINFDAQGLFVFPKVIYDFGNFYRNGTHDMYIKPEGGGIVEVMRYATSTVVRDDHIVMHMNPGGSTGGVANHFPDPVGARYFILGAATL